MKSSTESVIHDAMYQLAQDIYDTHGIRVKDVSFEWLDLGARQQVSDVQVASSTKRIGTKVGQNS